MTRARWSLRCLTAVAGSVLPSRKITAKNPVGGLKTFRDPVSDEQHWKELHTLFACDSAILRRQKKQLMQVALQGCSFP